MLDEIARRLHFNYSIRIATDAAYGKEDENGRWSGIIGELTRRVNLIFVGGKKLRVDILFRQQIWVLEL
jgi:hypothetical protein